MDYGWWWWLVYNNQMIMMMTMCYRWSLYEFEYIACPRDTSFNSSSTILNSLSRVHLGCVCVRECRKRWSQPFGHMPMVYTLANETIVCSVRRATIFLSNTVQCRLHGTSIFRSHFDKTFWMAKRVVTDIIRVHAILPSFSCFEPN